MNAASTRTNPQPKGSAAGIRSRGARVQLPLDTEQSAADFRQILARIAEAVRLPNGICAGGCSDYADARFSRSKRGQSLQHPVDILRL